MRSHNSKTNTNKTGLKAFLEFNSYKPSVLFMGHWQIANHLPDQMPQNASSDQILHCLLTEYTFKVKRKAKIRNRYS